MSTATASAIERCRETHPTKGAFFTRGTSRNEDAVYTESPDAYVANMDRLLSKWETARELLPKPVINSQGHRTGLMFYGTTSDSNKRIARAPRASRHPDGHNADSGISVC